MISGASADQLQSADRKLSRTVLLNSVMFILGFSAVFIALGAVATGIGQFMNIYRRQLMQVAGIVIIIFGLHLIGVFQIKALLADKRLHEIKGSGTALGAFLIGFAFAFGWTPCIGPILAGVLAIAGSQDTVIKGVLVAGGVFGGIGGAVPADVTGRGAIPCILFAVPPASAHGGGGQRSIPGDRRSADSYPALHYFVELSFVPESFLTLRLFVKKNVAVLGFAVVVIAAMLFIGSNIARKRQAEAARSGSLVAGQIVGKPAPDFTLKTLDGKTLTLSDLRGKTVVLNFWATWCPPCKVELPWFVDLQKQYGPQGLQIVGISEDEGGKDKVVQFVKEMGVNYTIAVDDSSVSPKYGDVEDLPTTFYIDRNGKIVAFAMGLLDRSEIEQKMKAALAQ